MFDSLFASPFNDLTWKGLANDGLVSLENYLVFRFNLDLVPHIPLDYLHVIETPIKIDYLYFLIGKL